MTVRTPTARLATVLANAAADWLEATRPIDIKTTRALFDGAAIAAHALGYGRTSTEVFGTAMDFVKAHPRPAYGAGFPTERKAWSEAVEATLAENLDGLL